MDATFIINTLIEGITSLVLDGFKATIGEIVDSKLEDFTSAQESRIERIVEGEFDNREYQTKSEVNTLIEEAIEEIKTAGIGADEVVSLIENDSDVQEALKDYINANVSVSIDCA